MQMNSAHIDRLRYEANARLDPRAKAEFGQFMTPSRIAEFMASLFSPQARPAVLLDAGAGIGSLALAAARQLHPVRIEAWEIDPVLRGYLTRNLAPLAAASTVHAEDFIEHAVNRLQFRAGPGFTHAILNPPYKKIGTASRHRLLLRQAGIETVNLYAGFVALAILLLAPAGELVAIVPRSFCNGPYYRPFRELLLRECAIDRLHVFESRRSAFRDDDVLQENLILKLTRGGAQGDVCVSFSPDASFDGMQARMLPFAAIVAPGDPERFIHVPTEEVEGNDHIFSHSLSELGIEVCTGPVVDFRLKEWFAPQPGRGTVPLIYPHHYNGAGLTWPREHKKPNALHRSPEVDKWLLPNGCYVLVKRFSAKEERRRIVAYLHDPRTLDAGQVGFENHWNVFHAGKQGLDARLARGLTVFLNASAVDRRFRRFSGHTQVNATDLRNMRYPSRAVLLRLGRACRPGLTQDAIDALLATIE
jgi:adenine-specific DNA-methyltransferase